MMIGPIQLVVAGFVDDKYARDNILEIKQLRQKKAIRIFDLLYMFKHQDGSIESKEVSDLQVEEQREFGTLIKSLIGLSAKDPEHVEAEEVAGAVPGIQSDFGLTEVVLQKVTADMTDGNSAIFIAFEHLSSRGFKEAVLQNNGRIVAQGMLDADTQKLQANELATVLEAIGKTEAASMKKMAEILAEAQTKEEEARIHAAEVEKEAESIEAADRSALVAP